MCCGFCGMVLCPYEVPCVHAACMLHLVHCASGGESVFCFVKLQLLARRHDVSRRLSTGQSPDLSLKQITASVTDRTMEDGKLCRETGALEARRYHISRISHQTHLDLESAWGRPQRCDPARAEDSFCAARILTSMRA